MPKAKRISLRARRLDARPDTVDFRDLMYVPTLVEVPTEMPLARYRRARVPILDQGREGACTGYGLATTVHFLLRTRHGKRDRDPISPAMLYAMARRYDEWPGEGYEGSSARGAMKGWHKHGVCSLALWKSSRPGKAVDLLTEDRARDARGHPLGAYFRVNHKDLVAMHAAIAEVGILYATASVHSGWDEVGSDGRIPFEKTDEGGHAFAIVGYDRDGFWIQNSWGADWGHDGFCHMLYDDWLENGTDVWVARLGAPVTLRTVEGGGARSAMAAKGSGYTPDDLRPHVVSLGNDGHPRPTGTYGTTKEGIEAIFRRDFPRITGKWKTKRVLLYAHGGLVGEEGALQRIADVRQALLQHEVYPLAFVWHSDYWTTITNALRDATRTRRAEGALDAAKDFMLDRVDDMLEPVARLGTGKLVWREMKENALAATEEPKGGARLVATLVAALAKRGVEVHVAGHSAGSILHAPLVAMLAKLGVTIRSCTLWAPACTATLFKKHYLPAIQSGRVERFGLFTLTDAAEQDDDCAGIYHKSLLYLVSHAFEKEPRIPLVSPGEPLLGMAKGIEGDAKLRALFTGGRPNVDWVQAPNQAPEGSPNASTARHHGDFDDDRATILATLARILGRATVAAPLRFEASASARRNRRQALNAAG
jgi:Papain family cysteine protease